ncbi:MAG: hypothetical protein IT308_07035 [Anaerolineaceae bacterium]|nr:hypothetical protein [Anaerolineaceae bacterium]
MVNRKYILNQMETSTPPSPPPPRRAGKSHRIRRDTPPAAILRDEITMLRAMIRRVTALADDGRSLEELLHVLDTLGSASSRVARLLKAEHDFMQQTEDIGALLNQALGEVIETLKREG